MSEQVALVAKLEEDIKFMRDHVKYMENRIEKDLRYLDSAIDADRKRLETIESKLNDINAKNDNDRAEDGSAVEGLLQVNHRLNDLLRWRNAHEEPPQEPTTCLVVLGDNAYMDVTNWTKETPWSTGIITHWRPIGPLPGGE